MPSTVYLEVRNHHIASTPNKAQITPFTLPSLAEFFNLSSKMVETQRITDPSSLSDITIGLSNLGLESSDSSSVPHTKRAKLVLLQPLANADTLATCRDPNSRVIRNQDGVFARLSNYEDLNIQPLSAA